MFNNGLPLIIQGGMGAGVSDWRLARAVSLAGQLGVVSGTALDVIMARRLQLGDVGGHIRRALERFPVAGVAQRILERYFRPGGKDPGEPFKSKPMPSEKPSRHGLELLVASNFVEVYLARESHGGLIGINYLEKIQAPTLPSLYGAMLAGVSCVLMGAGIPRAIPGILDRFARGQSATLRLDVQACGAAAAGEAAAGAGQPPEYTMAFDPAEFWGSAPPELARPQFYAIVSSATLAGVLAKKASGRVDGFIVEGPTAGGHNAPPRGAVRLNDRGEPIYGERDVADLAAIAALGLPFWLAGSYASPEKLAEARAQGAAGVQIGTAFAYCQESGLDAAIKQRVLALSRAGEARVFTDPVASPTGFPFKVVQLTGTLSDPVEVEKRKRICDLGYLRQAYAKADGKIGWRCPSEPDEDYLAKGGKPEELRGRLCVCNGLMANIGLGQVRDGELETALVTSGDDVQTVARFLRPGAETYSALDVIRQMLGVPMEVDVPVHAAASL